MVSLIEALTRNTSVLACELLDCIGRELVLNEFLSFIYRPSGHSCCNRHPERHGCQLVELEVGSLIVIEGYRYSEYWGNFQFRLRVGGQILLINQDAFRSKIATNVFTFKASQSEER